MFKWLGRYQSQKAIDEVIEFLKRDQLEVTLLRSSLGLILCHLFAPLPMVSASYDEKESLVTKLYFLKTMLPKKTAKAIAANTYANAIKIEEKSGKKEEYMAHLIACGFVQLIGQIQGARSTATLRPHIFEIKKDTKDYNLIKRFEVLILQIYKDNEVEAFRMNYEYIDNLNANSCMHVWLQ